MPDWLPHERVRFSGNTGAQLAGRWFPAANPRGVVVLAHPDRRYGQHWFVMIGWVDFLHDAGFAVLTFDFPGYGESRGGATYFMEDIVGAARWAHERAPALPLHVLGVSMGAFAAANAAPRLDFVDGLVLESPYPTFNEWYGAGVGRVAMNLFDRAFPRTSALLQAQKHLARAGAKRILVVAAGQDDVTPPRLTRALVGAAPPERTRFLEVEASRHLQPFVDSPAYRAAVLETFLGRAGLAEPPSTARAVPIRASNGASSPRGARKPWVNVARAA